MTGEGKWGGFKEESGAWIMSDSIGGVLVVLTEMESHTFEEISSSST
jgi:hypothetical protein